MPINLRGLPTNTCPVCGNNWFIMTVAMEDGEVSAFLFDAKCADDDCGTLVTIACPPDLEEQNAGNQS